MRKASVLFSAVQDGEHFALFYWNGETTMLVTVSCVSGHVGSGKDEDREESFSCYHREILPEMYS